MPSWEDFKPFIVTGLALGGVYALSGVGMVVLYRATGVLNLAFGAVGAMGALIAWELINNNGWAAGRRPTSSASLFGGVVTLLYGVLFGPPLAGRDPLVKATATLGLALILLGDDVVDLERQGALDGPADLEPRASTVGDVFVNWTQVIALALRGRGHDRSPPRSCATRSSARRCARWPTTARSRRRSACRCGASRRRRGSAPGCSSGSRAGCCSPTSSGSTPPRSPSS